ncbi:hypothetical protein GUITHDRAFT_148024 [Guillardia theta CCMP2712]|uniref:Glycine-rich domain-containing protein n=1 Tax=Guillardia theta (strain CCMP2712) TaxID=905079 RepID=L1IAN5_GUITC|nr:hypothetical protein GUITHDRAFT_148024 [Guillardia theta CCMP2712]EKX33268.1 hypothetical protein GUITHDRAFT_148024 [Guillardia theta CCMP2712]|eukprot:XP_005820248.1 hypothetical protein GUITHDRAFT_148024 [Guillardia theta CCMP2712]
MTFLIDTVCDILIVGGGGAGGGRQGAGGGGGGVMYLTNQTITAGSHTITVGKGGVGTNAALTLGTKGFDSSFDSYTAYGGGAGAGMSANVLNYNASTYIIASGGGGRGWGASASDDGWYNGGLGNGNTSDLTLNGGVGNNGGRGYQKYVEPITAKNTGLLGGGGGGAGAVGGDATPNSATYNGKAGDGGNGIEINIKGGTGAGGLGGGGGGRNNAAGTAGTANTGGGGGGGGYANQAGGNGGSGVEANNIAAIAFNCSAIRSNRNKHKLLLEDYRFKVKPSR